MCIARATNPDASRTRCTSIARNRYGWCSSSNGPIGPRCWRISRCRLHATLSARCSRWRRPPQRFSSTTPPNWKSCDSRMHGWIAIPFSYCNATCGALGIQKDQTRETMSEDWNTKYGTRRVRRDPPTLDEAIFAAIGITDDQTAQAEIAASLMGLPIESVTAEVRKAGRLSARSSTRVIAGEQGAQRSVVVERRVIRKFGNDKRTGT